MILCEWMAEQVQRGIVKSQKSFNERKEVVESYDHPLSERMLHIQKINYFISLDNILFDEYGIISTLVEYIVIIL